MTGNGISVRNNKESLAALHIQRQHKIDKDNRCRRRKKMTRLRIVYCPRSSLTGVGWRRRLGQVVFGSAELRHPSCATLGTCILRCANFFFIFLILQKKTHFSQFEFFWENCVWSQQLHLEPLHCDNLWHVAHSSNTNIITAICVITTCEQCWWGCYWTWYWCW